MTAPRPTRIAVLAAPPGGADARRLARHLAERLQQAGRAVEAVLALDAADPHGEAALAAARGAGLVARPARWRRAGARLAPADGANDFLDCDLWLVVGATPDIALPRWRPWVAVLPDCDWRYRPELLDAATWARLERHGCALLREAAFVLVPDRRTALDVRAVAGVPAARLLEVPWPPASPADGDPAAATALADALLARCADRIPHAYR